MRGCWNKEHIQVLYRGVDITDKIGLCVCDECTSTVRGSVDALLDTKKSAKPAYNSRYVTALEVISDYQREHYSDIHDYSALRRFCAERLNPPKAADCT